MIQMALRKNRNILGHLSLALMIVLDGGRCLVFKSRTFLHLISVQRVQFFDRIKLQHNRPRLKVLPYSTFLEAAKGVRHKVAVTVHKID